MYWGTLGIVGGMIGGLLEEHPLKKSLQRGGFCQLTGLCFQGPAWFLQDFEAGLREVSKGASKVCIELGPKLP